MTEKYNNPKHYKNPNFYGIFIPAEFLASYESPYELSVFVALQAHAHFTTGECTPTYEEIAQAGRMSRSTAAKMLAKMKQDGWIDWTRRRYTSRNTGKNRTTSNRFRVPIAKRTKDKEATLSQLLRRVATGRNHAPTARTTGGARVRNKAIPTTYGNIDFRSRLEADTAFLLDSLGMAWEYEPRNFLLPDGTHYLPDFWIPELRLWVECRGQSTEKGERQIAQFGEWVTTGALSPTHRIREATTWDGERGRFAPIHAQTVDYLVISNGAAQLYEYQAAFSMDVSEARIIVCRECGRASFVGADGSYRCRSCGAHDGDHHLQEWRTISVEDGILCVDGVPVRRG